jgi:hypothetical protein
LHELGGREQVALVGVDEPNLRRRAIYDCGDHEHEQQRYA